MTRKKVKRRKANRMKPQTKMKKMMSPLPQDETIQKNKIQQNLQRWNN